MPYVYSTATCGSFYCEYVKNSAGDMDLLKKVEVKGGHGVATPFKNSNLHQVHTPKGVATFVSDEDLAFLKANTGFMEAHDAGFITWDEKEIKPEIRAKDMKDRDGSAPLTPENLDAGDNSDEQTTTYKRKK